MRGNGALPAALVDIDGTLVDSNYQHALAWFRALRHHGVVRPLWEIHRHIGMGGDHMVAALAGDEVERAAGDAIRSAEGRFYGEMIDEVEPLPGARDALLALAGEGRVVVLVTSAKPEEAEHYLDLLDARDVVSACVTGADVDATKPDPDLVEAGRRRAGGGPAVMIGDSTWDCRAADRAGIPCVAVLTGGFSEQELRDAGAVTVHRSLTELIDAIAGRGSPDDSEEVDMQEERWQRLLLEERRRAEEDLVRYRGELAAAAESPDPRRDDAEGHIAQLEARLAAVAEAEHRLRQARSRAR